MTEACLRVFLFVIFTTERSPGREDDSQQENAWLRVKIKLKKCLNVCDGLDSSCWTAGALPHPDGSPNAALPLSSLVACYSRNPSNEYGARLSAGAGQSWGNLVPREKSVRNRFWSSQGLLGRADVAQAATGGQEPCSAHTLWSGLWTSVANLRRCIPQQTL